MNTEDVISRIVKDLNKQILKLKFDYESELNCWRLFTPVPKSKEGRFDFYGYISLQQLDEDGSWPSEYLDERPYKQYLEIVEDFNQYYLGKEYIKPMTEGKFYKMCPEFYPRKVKGTRKKLLLLDEIR